MLRARLSIPAISVIIGAVLAGTLPAQAAPVAEGTLVSHASTSNAAVYFEAGSAVLTSSAASVLATVADRHKSGWAIHVVGYVQQSAASANDRSLALSRAVAVSEFLRAHRVSGSVSVSSRGIFAAAAHSASARVVIVTWTQTAPESEPSSQPVVPQSSTAQAGQSAAQPQNDTATVATGTAVTTVASTCNVHFDAQGGTMADTGTLTVVPGASVQMPTVLYGPGDFNGWFTNAFTGYSSSDTATFVAYATQSVPVACVNGSTVTYYAHWAAPQPMPQIPASHIELSGYLYGFSEVVSGCSGTCPNAGPLSSRVDQTLGSTGAQPISITLTPTYGFYGLEAWFGTGALGLASSIYNYEYQIAVDRYGTATLWHRAPNSGPVFYFAGSVPAGTSIRSVDGAAIAFTTTANGITITYTPNAQGGNTDSIRVMNAL